MSSEEKGISEEGEGIDIPKPEMKTDDNPVFFGSFFNPTTVQMPPSRESVLNAFDMQGPSSRRKRPRILLPKTSNRATGMPFTSATVQDTNVPMAVDDKGGAPFLDESSKRTTQKEISYHVTVEGIETPAAANVGLEMKMDDNPVFLGSFFNLATVQVAQSMDVGPDGFDMQRTSSRINRPRILQVPKTSNRATGMPFTSATVQDMNVPMAVDDKGDAPSLHESAQRTTKAMIFDPESIEGNYCTAAAIVGLGNRQPEVTRATATVNSSLLFPDPAARPSEDNVNDANLVGNFMSSTSKLPPLFWSSLRNNFASRDVVPGNPYIFPTEKFRKTIAGSKVDTVSCSSASAIGSIHQGKCTPAGARVGIVCCRLQAIGSKARLQSIPSSSKDLAKGTNPSRSFLSSSEKIPPSFWNTFKDEFDLNNVVPGKPFTFPTEDFKAAVTKSKQETASVKRSSALTKFSIDSLLMKKTGEEGKPNDKIEETIDTVISGKKGPEPECQLFEATEWLPKISQIHPYLVYRVPGDPDACYMFTRSSKTLKHVYYRCKECKRLREPNVRVGGYKVCQGKFVTDPMERHICKPVSWLEEQRKVFSRTPPQLSDPEIAEMERKKQKRKEQKQKYALAKAAKKRDAKEAQKLEKALDAQWKETKKMEEDMGPVDELLLQIVKESLSK